MRWRVVGRVLRGRRGRERRRGDIVFDLIQVEV
jgi:hypothetical protein